MTDGVTRVLFVCLGNICRSPMAHGLFQHRVAQRGLAPHVEVDSAGTAAYHTGDAPDPRTLAVLARHGIALQHRARAVVDEDFVRFDHILAMDSDNLRNLLRRCPPGARGRVTRVLDDGDVPDPYYGGPAGFDANLALLLPAVDRWIDRMLGGN